MEARFPLRVVQSLAASIEAVSGVLVEEREWLVTSYCDILQILKAEDGRFLTFVGKSSVQDLQQKRNQLDSEGFASIVFDEVIAVAPINKEDRVLLVALHRSGNIRTYAEVLPIDQEPSNDNSDQPGNDNSDQAGNDNSETMDEETEPLPVFKRIAAWHFGHGTPRFISTHAKLVAVATMEGSVSVFDAESGACTHRFTGLVELGDLTTCLKFHPRRNLLLLGTSKGTFILMDLIRQCVIACCAGHDAAITDAAFVDVPQPDKTYAPVVVTGSRDKWLKLWELREITEKLQAVCKVERIDWGSAPSASEKSAKGKSSKKHKGTSEQAANLIKSTMDENPKLKELSRTPAAQCHVSEEIEGLCVLTKAMLNLETVNSGASWFVCVGGESGRLRVWDLLASREISAELSVEAEEHFGCPLAPIGRLFRSGDGKAVLAMGSDLSVVHWSTSPVLKAVRALKGASGTSTSHCVFVENAKLNILSSSVTGMLQKTLLKLDRKRTPAEITELDLGENAYVAACDVTTDGTVGALALSSGEVRILNPKSGSPLAQVPPGVTGPLSLVKLSRKALKSPCPHDIVSGCPFVAAVGADETLRIWRLPFEKKSGEKVLVAADALAKVSEKSVYAMAIAPNDKLLVTGGADKKLKIWEVPTLNLLNTCVGHKQAITAVALSPFEQIAVSAGLDMTLKLWNLKTAEVVKSLVGFESSLMCLSFMLDGIRILGGSSDGRIHLWDTKTGVHLGGSQRHASHVSCVAEVSPGVIVSCSQDGSVCVWSDETAKVEEENLERKREERNEIASVETLLARNEWAEALRLSLKWRRQNLFERVLLKLGETVSQLSQPNTDRSQSDANLKDLTSRLANFLPENAEEQETILLAALHFCKSAKKLHLAQFIANLLLQKKNVLRLREVEGFTEFVSTFNAKTETHVDRLERLREKSYLIDLILDERHL